MGEREALTARERHLLELVERNDHPNGYGGNAYTLSLPKGATARLVDAGYVALDEPCGCQVIPRITDKGRHAIREAGGDG